MQIRTLKETELELLFNYAKLEEWDVEKYHTISLFKIHSKDFFIVHLDNTLIGFIIALKISKELGFISSFLILKEFRSLGYGKELFEFALGYLDSCQIALDSVLGKEFFYEKYGFKIYFDVIMYKFEVGTFTLPETYVETITYNKDIHTLQNKEYLKNMISYDEVLFHFVKNNGESLAFRFEYIDGYQIAIETEDINEAVTLFFSLVENLEKGTPIYIQVTKLSPMLLSIVELLQMSEYSKFTRMYNKLLD